MNIEDFMKLGFHTLGAEGISKIAAQGQNAGPQGQLPSLSNITDLIGQNQRKIRMTQNPDGSMGFSLEEENESTPIDPALIISGKSNQEYMKLMLNSFDDDKLEMIEEIESNSEFPRQHFVREVVQRIRDILNSNKIKGINVELNYGKEAIEVKWNILEGSFLPICLGKNRVNTLISHAQKEKQIKRIQGETKLENAITVLNTLGITISLRLDIESAKITSKYIPIRIDEKLVHSKEVGSLVQSVKKVLDSTLQEITHIPKIKPPPLPMKKIKEAFNIKDDGLDDRDQDDDDDDDDRDDGSNPLVSLGKGFASMLFGIAQMTGVTDTKWAKDLKGLFKDGIASIIGVTPAYRASAGNIFVTQVENSAKYLPYVLKNTGMIITRGLQDYLDVTGVVDPPANTPTNPTP
jgi:hypothetical protein